MKRPTTGSLTLTTLPDIAIDEILTRLRIKDAVRTSVLSRAWRRRWQSIPALCLGDLSDIAIYQLLLRHSSPVKSCVFRPLPKTKKKEPCPIYCWLSTLSHRSASTLLSLTVIFDGPLSINSLASYFPNFTITNAPLLETLIVSRCFDGDETSSLSVEALAGAPRIKRLEVDYMCLQVWAWNLKQAAGGQMPMTIPVAMENLRVMSLSVNFTSNIQISLALCLLRSSPTIEELEIRGCYYTIPEKEYRAGKEFWEAQKHVDVFDRLRRVKMTEIKGIKSELDFIHFVLAKAHTLKTMMVTLGFSDFSLYVESFKTKEWLKTKLLGFPRASNQARILLTNEAEAEELEEWG